MDTEPADAKTALEAAQNHDDALDLELMEQQTEKQESRLEGAGELIPLDSNNNNNNDSNSSSNSSSSNSNDSSSSSNDSNSSSSSSSDDSSSSSAGSGGLTIVTTAAVETAAAAAGGKTKPKAGHRASYGGSAGLFRTAKKVKQLAAAGVEAAAAEDAKRMAARRLCQERAAQVKTGFDCGGEGLATAAVCSQFGL
jgi:hypothetical protein